MDKNFFLKRGADEVPVNPIERLKPLQNDITKRMKTFENFPHLTCNHSALALATYGFFYVGDGNTDKIQCAFCGGIIYSLNDTNDTKDLAEYHQHVVPECKSQLIYRTTDNCCMYPKYSSPIARTASYNAATNSSGDQTYCNVAIKDLVNAGLFYSKIKGQTICYYCGGTLCDWEIGDIPIIEHNKWFPDCYLTQCK